MAIHKSVIVSKIIQINRKLSLNKPQLMAGEKNESVEVQLVRGQGLVGEHLTKPAGAVGSAAGKKAKHCLPDAVGRGMKSSAERGQKLAGNIIYIALILRTKL